MKAITVRYIGPTNTRGARLKADDGDGNTVTISFPHELSRDDAFRSAASALCQKMGWTGTLAQGGTRGAEVFCFVKDWTTFTV